MRAKPGIFLLGLLSGAAALGAISEADNDTGTATNAGDITLNFTALEGDYAFVVNCDSDPDGDNALGVTTMGYTVIGTELFSGDDANGEMYYKRMGSTPDSSVVVTSDGGGNAGHSAAVFILRGIDETTPYDGTPTTATHATTALPNPPSNDHDNTSGVWTLIAGCSSHLEGTVTWTFPSGYTTTQLTDHVVDSRHSDVVMAYNPSPSDPEDPAAWTWDGTDVTGYSSVSWTVPLLAAEGASITPVLQRNWE